MKSIKELRGELTRKQFSSALSDISTRLLPDEPAAEITERMIEGWEQGRRNPTVWGLYILKKYQEVGQI